jgi:ABC-2 type transport system permease protein
MRTLLQDGWDWAPIGGALLSIAGVGIVSFGLAFAALRGRVKRN